VKRGTGSGIQGTLRLSRQVSDAQSGRVFGVAGRPIRLWQVADEVAVNTLLVTVKLADGPWLAIDESTDLHPLGLKSYGRGAAVHALRAIARSADAELRLHAEMYRPNHPPCARQTRRADSPAAPGADASRSRWR
jgi:hypothetical protein